MSRNILFNQNIMDSCKERSEMERNRQNRLKEVRKQSNLIAQKLRENVRNERENQMRRLEKLKEFELMEWKKQNICSLGKKLDQETKCVGEAHRAAVDEEIQMGIFRDKREEFDLIAAQRGRHATQKQQDEKRQQEEERVMKRKRLKQKTIGIQANLLQVPLDYDCEDFDSDDQDLSMCAEESNDEESKIESNPKPSYNPKNFATTNSSTESSIVVQKSVPPSQSDSEESLQFNQITNILKKKKLFNIDEKQPEDADVIEISDYSDCDNVIPPPLPPKQTKTAKKIKTPKKQLPKKVIVKSPHKFHVAGKQKSSLKYYDVGSDRKYAGQSTTTTETTYSGGYSANSIGKSKIVKGKEVLEKERVRKDYEQLREELDLLSKEDQQARTDGKKTSSYSTKQFEKATEEKRNRMEAAFENVLKNRTILTCPPVNEPEKHSKSSKKSSEEINVGQDSETEADESIKNGTDSCASIFLGQKTKSKKKTDKASDDSVNIEKLKDLLERINHQKRMMHRELEKHENIPGPDLEKVIRSIEQLEKEKKVLTSSSSESGPSKQQKEKLLDREKKLEEREKRLEERIKELYRQQKKQQHVIDTDSTTNSDVIDSPAPVEILIKVNPKSPKARKTKKYKVIRCVDTLSRGPGKVYPKTPIRKKEAKKNVNFETILDALKKKQKEYLDREDSKKKSGENVEVPEEQNEDKVADNRKKLDKLQIFKQKSIEIEEIPTETSNAKNLLEGSSKSKEIEKKQKEKQTSDDHTKERPQKKEEAISKVPEIPRKTSEKQIEKPQPSQKSQEIVKKPATSERQKKSSPKDFDIYNATDSTSYRSLPDDIPLRLLESQKREEAARKLNPFLMHYIARLLGMPKKVGESLGVSSTTVSTPGSSTINTSANVSEESTPSFDSVRLDQLKKFIDENYSFLSEVNESLERSQVEKSEEENFKDVEGVWKDVLTNSAKKNVKKVPEKKGILKKTDATSSKSDDKRITESLVPTTSKSTKKSPPKRVETNIPQNQEAPEENPPKSQETHQIQQSSPPHLTSDDLLNITKYMEAHMLSNYVEYTNNCQKRIADLTEIMQKVRDEKTKLLENATQPQKSPKHLEFATSSGSELRSPSHRDDPPSEEINNILTVRSRQIGVSKDSGISMSRPPSDYRDSPENAFQPIAKNPGPSDQDLARIIIHSLGKIVQPKKLKPPTSMPRRSPQLEENRGEPHELSTIVEVETSGTSKINITDIDKENVEDYQGFMDYDKYVQSQKQSQESPGPIEEPHKSLETLKDPGVTSYQKFTDPKTYGIAEISSLHQSSNHSSLENLKNAGVVSYQEFEDPKSYGIQELSSLHSERMREGDGNESEKSSIQDLVAELKRRKVIESSDNESASSRTSTSPLKKILEKEKREEEAGPSGMQENRQDIQSEMLHRNLEIPKSNPADGGENSTKSSTRNEGHQNDTLSGIAMIPRDDNNLQGDLKKIGLDWAASTLKRTQQSQTVYSSSTSSENPLFLKRTIEIEVDETPSASTSTSSVGKPVNLREFLRRELTIRTPKNVTNESSVESPFSLISSSLSSSSKSTDKKFLRTSTPVEDTNKLSRESSRRRFAQESNLFLAGNLSKVKLSSSDESINDKREEEKE